MLYENYERKIMKVAKVKNFVVKFRILFISLITAILALTTGYLSTKGMVTGEVTVPTNLVYGQAITCDAEALFTDIAYFEYRKVTEDVWSREVPTEIGDYYVRAVTEKPFGRKGYSKETPFTISPKDLKITISSSSVVYGTNPQFIAEGLEYNDKITEIGFNFEDVKLVQTSASLNMDLLVITNVDGVNVTSSYNVITEAKDINITPTTLTIKPVDCSKVYDGIPFVHNNEYEIVSGSVYNNDALTISTKYTGLESEPVNVGTYNTEIEGYTLHNGNVDVTHQYTLKSQKGTMTITKRPITIKTNNATQVYNAKALSTLNKTDYSVIEGSLVEGHELVILDAANITNVGTKENKITFKIIDKDGNDVTANYEISYEYGTLEVTPFDVKIILGAANSVYDNTVYNQTASFTLDKELFNGDSIAISTYTTLNGVLADAKDAGTYELHVDLDRIKFTSGGNNSSISNYNFTYESSNLIIAKRSVTIQPLSQEFYYTEQNIITKTKDFIVVVDNGEEVNNRALIDNIGVELNLIYKQGNTIYNPLDGRFNYGEYQIVIDSYNDELKNNYIVSCVENTLNINKTPVVISPIELGSIVYNATEYKYDSSKFVMINALNNRTILDETGTISVKFKDINGEEITPINASTYYVEIIGHSSNLDTNYEVRYGADTNLVITPCEVTIKFNNTSSHVYDGNVFDYYDKSFTTTPNLYNNATISFNTYVTNENNVVVSPIDANTYRLHVNLDSIEVENDLESNYSFKYEWINIYVNRRNITLKPIEGIEFDYNGQEYYYQESLFEVFNKEDDKVNVEDIIPNGAYITVNYQYGDTEALSSYAKDAGVYTIVITGHSENFNANFNVVGYESSLMTINKCKVTIEFNNYSSKVYDGLEFNDYDTSYSFINESTNGMYLYAPNLLDDERISNISTYLSTSSDKNADKNSAINVGTYYIHFDLANTEFEGNATNYEFDYIAREIEITPRYLTIVANPTPNSIRYNGSDYASYSNAWFTVFDSYNDEVYYNDLNANDNATITVDVEYYDENNNLVKPRNVGTYYVNITDYEFTGANKEIDEANYVITVGEYYYYTEYISLEITPVEVDVRIHINPRVVYNGEEFDYVSYCEENGHDKFQISRSTYPGAATALINGDYIVIDNAIYYTLLDAENTEDNRLIPVNAGNYTVYVDLSKIEFYSGNGNNSIAENYTFSSNMNGYLTILKREVTIEVEHGLTTVYNGSEQPLSSDNYVIVKDNGETIAATDLVKTLVDGLTVTVSNFTYKTSKTATDTVSPINAGTYYVYIDTYNEEELSANYDITVSDSGVVYVIEKRAVEIMPLEQDSIVYDGTTYVYPSTDFVVIKDNGEDTYSDSLIDNAPLEITIEFRDEDGNISTPTNAGKYYMYVSGYSFDDDYSNGNYTIDYPKYVDDISNGVEFVIEKREVTIRPINPGTLEYDGTEYKYPTSEFVVIEDNGNTVENSSLIDGSQLELNVIITGDYPVCRNAGTYYIGFNEENPCRFVVEEEGYNYIINADNTLQEFVITPADVLIEIYDDAKVFDGIEYDYDSSNFKLTVGSKGLSQLFNGDKITDFDVVANDYTTIINANTYSISVDLSSIVFEKGGDDSDSVITNYNFSTNTVTLLISPREITVTTLDQEGKTYDAKAFVTTNDLYKFADGNYENKLSDDDLIDLINRYLYSMSVLYNGETEAINADTYIISIDMNNIDADPLFYQNFDVTYENIGKVIIAKRDVSLKPISQVHPYSATVYEYPIDAYEIYDGSLVDLHYAEVSVIYTQGTMTTKEPIEVGIYNIYIDEALIFDENGNDVTNNYEITKYDGNDITLDIQKILVKVTALSQDDVVYGVSYSYPEDAYEIIVDEEGHPLFDDSSLKVTVYYIGEDGTEYHLPNKPVNAGVYKILIESVEVVGNHQNAYKFEFVDTNATFKILKREAAIKPLITNELVYDFDKELEYILSFEDVSDSYYFKEDHGILEQDINNISFAILIYYNNASVDGFTIAGDYVIYVDESTALGLDNYEVTYETNTINVEKLDIIIELDDKSKTYDGEALEFINEFSISRVDGNEVYDYVNAQFTVSYNGEVSAPINAGTYTVSINDDWYFYNTENGHKYGNDNFAVELIDAEYIIKQREITIEYEESYQEFVYDGEEIEFNNTYKVTEGSIVSGDELDIFEKFELVDGLKFDSLLPINAGTYRTEYLGYEDLSKNDSNIQNYDVTFDKPATIVITPRKVIITPISGLTGVYKNEIYDNYPSDKFVAYDVEDDIYRDNLIDNAPLYITVEYRDKDGVVVSPKNAGTYYMYVNGFVFDDDYSIGNYAIDSPKYIDSISNGVEFIITPRAVTIKPINPGNMVYNGEIYSYPINEFVVTMDDGKQVNNNALIDGAELKLNVNIICDNITDDNIVRNVGTYYIEFAEKNPYKFTDETAANNYAVTLDTSLVEFAITPFEVDVTLYDDEKVYDGLEYTSYEKGFELSSDLFNDDYIEIKATILCPGSIEAPINAGEYKIYVYDEDITFHPVGEGSVKGNYAFNVIASTLTIHKRKVTIGVEKGITHEYTGSTNLLASDNYVILEDNNEIVSDGRKKLIDGSFIEITDYIYTIDNEQITPINVGKYDTVIYSYNKSIETNFNITVSDVPVIYEITPKALVFKPVSIDYPFTNHPFVYDDTQYELIEGTSLIDKHTATIGVIYKQNGEIITEPTLVGEYEIYAVSAIIKDSKGVDVSSNYVIDFYEGSDVILDIYQNVIEVRVKAQDPVVYGNEYNHDPKYTFEIVSGTILEGSSIEIPLLYGEEKLEKAINAGTYNLYLDIDNVKVIGVPSNAYKVEVLNQGEVEFKITPRAVTIKPINPGNMVYNSQIYSYPTSQFVVTMDDGKEVNNNALIDGAELKLNVNIICDNITEDNIVRNVGNYAIELISVSFVNEDDANNYIVTPDTSLVEFKITPFKVDLTLFDDEKTYDGEEYTSYQKGFELSTELFNDDHVEDIKITILQKGKEEKAINAGEYVITVYEKDITFKESEGSAKGNYKFNVITSTLTIHKRKVTIGVESGITHEYTGAANLLASNDYVILEDDKEIITDGRKKLIDGSFIEITGYTYTINKEQVTPINVGEYDVIVYGYNKSIETNYEISISTEPVIYKITPKTVVFKPYNPNNLNNPNSFLEPFSNKPYVYKGTDYTTIDGTSLIDKHTATISVIYKQNGEIISEPTLVGEYEIYAVSAIIKDSKGNDVSSNYAIDFYEGSDIILTIYQNTIEVRVKEQDASVYGNDYIHNNIITSDNYLTHPLFEIVSGSILEGTSIEIPLLYGEEKLERAINVGTYSIYLDTDNIKIIGVPSNAYKVEVLNQGEVEFEITPRPVSIMPVINEKLVYNFGKYLDYTVTFDEDLARYNKKNSYGILTSDLANISFEINIYCETQLVSGFTNAGTYVIEVKLEDSNNPSYKVTGLDNYAVTYVLNENVSVGQLEMIVQLTDKTDTYNGQALEFKNIPKDYFEVSRVDKESLPEDLMTDVTVTYSSVDAPINAGSYTVEVNSYRFYNETTEFDNANFKVTTKSAKYTIDRRNILLEYTNLNQTFVYDGEEIEFVDTYTYASEIEFVAGDDVVIYTGFKLIEGLKYDDELFPINAGTYESFISKYEDTTKDPKVQNYNIEFTQYATVVVTPRQVTITPIHDLTSVYNGQEYVKYPSNQFVVVMDDEEVVEENSLIDNAPLNITVEYRNEFGEVVSPINVGTYYMYVTGYEFDDDYSIANYKVSYPKYEDSISNGVVFAITRRDVVISAADPGKIIYSGDIYSYRKEGTPDPFVVTMDNNKPSNNDALIDGSELKLTVEFYDEKGNIVSPKNAGTYYIHVSKVEFVDPLAAANYNAQPSEDDVKFEISKYQIDIKFYDDEKTYDGNVYDSYDKGYELQTELLNGDSITLTHSIILDGEAVDAVNAGKYSIGALSDDIIFTQGSDADSVKGNYKFNILPGTLTINRRKVTIGAVGGLSNEYIGDVNPLGAENYVILEDDGVEITDGRTELCDGTTITGITFSYSLNGQATSPINVGVYDVVVYSYDTNFDLNFEITKSKDAVTYEITAKEVWFKPVECIHPFDNTVYTYDINSYELIEGTELIDKHSATVTVKFMLNGEEVINPTLVASYEIYITNAIIVDADGNDVSGNYDINCYKGNDVFLHIYQKAISVDINDQDNVTYGEKYTHDPKLTYTLVSGEFIDGYVLEIPLLYVDSEGNELEKAVNAGTYTLKLNTAAAYVDGIDISVYEITVLNEGEVTFTIDKRDAYIKPTVSKLVYNFGDVLTDYELSIEDVSKQHIKNRPCGILKADAANIKFNISIYDSYNTQTNAFTNVGMYYIYIDEESVEGIENYNILGYVQGKAEVNKLTIVVDVESKTDIYDGSSLVFDSTLEYNLYTDTSLKELIGHDLAIKNIVVTYGYSYQPPVHVGRYDIHINECTLYNTQTNRLFDKSNFEVICNAVYEITPRDITVSLNNTNQSDIYTGKEFAFDSSYTVVSGSIVTGDRLVIHPTFIMTEGVEHDWENAPIHVGKYTTTDNVNYISYDINENPNYSDYNVTVNNIANVEIKQREITLKALPKTYTFNGQSYLYTTGSATESYMVTSGSVADGDVFLIGVYYVDSLGVIDTKAIYAGTYAIRLDLSDVVTYVNGNLTEFNDYIITEDKDYSSLVINPNVVTIDLETGHSYNAKNDYQVYNYITYKTPLANNVVVTNLVYSYYDGETLLLDKPTNAGENYYVSLSDYTVYFDGVADEMAKKSIVFENQTERFGFQIKKRDLTINVKTHEKTYDGSPYTGVINHEYSGLVSGHEFTYELTSLYGDINSFVDAGEYTVCVDLTTIKFEQEELINNYNIITTEGGLKINPRPINLVSTVTFDEIYSDEVIEINGSQWKYADGSLELLEGSITVEFEILGTRTEVSFDSTTGQPNEERKTYELTEIRDAYDYEIKIARVITKDLNEDNYSFVLDKSSSYGTISPLKIGIITGSYKGYYNGIPLRPEQVDADPNTDGNQPFMLLPGYTLMEGHELIYYGQGFPRISVVTGEDGIANEMSHGVVLKDENGIADLTYNYEVVEKKTGTITILPRVINITTGSTELVYNGAAQSYEVYTSNARDENDLFEDDQFRLLDGHEIKITKKPTIINVGSIENKLEFKIVDTNNNSDVTGNYIIDPTNGTITITPLDIYIKLTDQSFGFIDEEYDATKYIEICDKNGEEATILGNPTQKYTLSITLDGEEKDLIYSGNYVVRISGVQFIKSKDDITNNFRINYYQNKDSFNFEITRVKARFYTYSYAKLWDGTELDGRSGSWLQYINVTDENRFGTEAYRWEFDEYTILKPYFEDGTPNFGGNVINHQTIKIYDKNNQDITDSFDIEYTKNATLSFTDSFSIHSTGSIYENKAYQLESDSKGLYITSYDIRTKDGAYISSKYQLYAKVYIKAIYTSYYQNGTEIKTYVYNEELGIYDGMVNAGVYYFDIYEELTEMYIDGMLVASGLYEFSYDHLYHSISRRQIAIKVKDNAPYPYDGNEIKYEGFGLVELIDQNSLTGGTLLDGDEIWITTIIDNDDIGSSKSVGILELKMYRNGEIYTNWEDNYCAIYYLDTGSSKTSYIVNNIVEYYDDGEPVYRYKASNLKGKFKCERREIILWTSSPEEKVYDGTPYVFTQDDCEVLNPEILLPGHEFVIVEGKWKSNTTVGTSTNTISSSKAWKVIDASGNDVSDYYSLPSKSKNPNYGTITILPRTIVIGTASESKTYQEVQQLPDYVLTYYGKTLTAEDIFVIEGSLAEGDYIDYESCKFLWEARLYDVGTIENTLDKLVIRNKSGSIVTKSYDYEDYYVFGTLQITAV